MQIKKVLMAMWLFAIVTWQACDFYFNVLIFRLFCSLNQVEEITNIQSFHEQMPKPNNGIHNRNISNRKEFQRASLLKTKNYKLYVIYRGHQPDIYPSWKECE